MDPERARTGTGQYPPSRFQPVAERHHERRAQNRCGAVLGAASLRAERACRVKNQLASPTRKRVAHSNSIFQVAEVIGDREERDRAYAESLERLRAHSREAIPILYDAVHDLQDAPMEQFTAVKTLADLESAEAFEALDDIAREPLAPVDEPDHHHKPLLTRDRVLRSQAIKGLARLARSGLESARQSLYEIATDPANDQHRSLRFHAVNGFVGTGPGSEARAAAMKLLPPLRPPLVARARFRDSSRRTGRGLAHSLASNPDVLAWAEQRGPSETPSARHRRRAASRGYPPRMRS